MSCAKHQSGGEQGATGVVPEAMNATPMAAASAAETVSITGDATEVVHAAGGSEGTDNAGALVTKIQEQPVPWALHLALPFHGRPPTRWTPVTPPVRRSVAPRLREHVPDEGAAVARVWRGAPARG